MRKWLQNIMLSVVVLLLMLFLLEGSYRYYWVDYYAPEFEALNPAFGLSENTGLKKILVAGDSFTANANSYVSELRSSLSAHYSVINCAVSGTGILEASYFLPSRIAEFEPDIFIYQIYLGNDLLDIKHRPTGEVGFLRNMYYVLSDKFRFLKFVNYRFGQIRRSFYTDVAPQVQPQGKPFSTEGYAPRQKLIFREEPRIIDNTLHLLNGRAADMKVLTERLLCIVKGLKPQAKVYLLVVPHCAEVSKTYKERMELIGAKFSGMNQPGDFLSALENALPTVTVLDAKPFLQEEQAKGAIIFYEDDPHLSENGQRLVGEWLKEKCTL